MSKWLIISGTLSAILLSVLFGGSYASAVSVYDDSVRLIDPLIIPASDATGERDYSLDWYNEALEAAQLRCDSVFPGDSCQMVTDLENLLTDPDANWAVIYQPSAGGYEILYSFDEDATTVFTEEMVLITATTVNEIGGFRYFPEASNQYLTPNKTQLSLSSIDTGTSKALSHVNRSVFLSTFPVTYPAGYEGEIIPDSYTEPTPPLEWTPDINMVNVVDWKITLQDQNFNTFDNVPFTCDQGLTPVIEYDLYNNDTDPITKLDTGVFSPTVPFEFQSEKYDIETEYKFIGNYYCGDGINTFSGQKTYYFTVNSSGVYVPPTDTCYTETFPYIDLNGCTGVMENFINNLSFGAITFPDWSINNDGCHTLGVIGDWINVPSSSRTICPQFSSTVRNIVTPFLTFVLGITILGVIVTKTRSDTH